MPEKKAHEILHKNQIELADVADRKVALRHLRQIVKTENLPFDVFRELVKLRK
jgi:hypothetical protein